MSILRKRRLHLTALLACAAQVGMAQYAPPAGQPGSAAMHRDSSAFVAWAAACDVVRGPMNIAEPALGFASAGLPEMAIGQSMGTVSLGDGGSATLTFSNPIVNGTGSDFAVFENGFDDIFLELAFVEVSSDGQQFSRFPSISLTSTDEQVNGFGSVDATKVHNLAGKYRAMYGTPFDLSDLEGTAGLDLDHITHVRIIDVVGNVTPDFATYDSEDHAVNDPWPTPWEIGGFDLDAVGAIHVEPSGIRSGQRLNFTLGPNPATDLLQLRSNVPLQNIRVLDMQGREMLRTSSDGQMVWLDVSSFPTGIYLVQATSDNHTSTQRICISH